MIGGSELAEAEAASETRPDPIGSGAVLAAAACWATSGVFVKLFGQAVTISALSLAFWRDLVTFAVLLLGVGIFRPNWLRVRRSDLVWLAALGVSLGTFHVFWNLGVFLNGAAVATVQQAAMPAIVAVVAWLAWRESLTRAKILAILCTMAGTVLVSGVDFSANSGIEPGSLLVGLGIPVTYAAWNLFGKRVRQQCRPFTVLTYAFGFGALVLLPLQFFTPQPSRVPIAAWPWFAGLIGLATLTGFALYTYALGRLPAGVASVLAMTEIAFVALYAYLLLGERLTTIQTLGAILVAGGAALLASPRQRGRA